MMDAVEQLREHEAECARRYETILVQLGEIKVQQAETKTKLAFHDKMLWAVFGVVIVSLAKDAIAPLVGT